MTQQQELLILKRLELNKDKNYEWLKEYLDKETRLSELLKERLKSIPSFSFQSYFKKFI